MSTVNKTIGILVIAIMATACQNSHSDKAIPARIVNPGIETRSELLHAVSVALNDATVTLADDAFTRSSLLVIERKRIRDRSNNPVMGRDLSHSPVEQFLLLLEDGRCLLLQRSTGKKWPLEKTRCMAE